MKNLIIATIIIFLSSSCMKHLPSKETLHQFVKQNPNAEKIDTNILKIWGNIFYIYRQSKDSSYIDLQSTMYKELVKKPEYAGILCNYYANAVNDSILFITDFDPILEKLEKEGSVWGIRACERKYIFHSNGDIEMKMGNMVSREEDGEDDGTFMKAYIDGNTGLIISYSKDDYGEDNTYRITKKGKLKIGEDYGYPSGTKKLATETFNILSTDLKLIASKMLR